MNDPLSVADELIDLLTTLATERKLEASLAAVVEAARRLTRAEAGRVLVLDRLGQNLHCIVGRNETVPAAATFSRAIPLYDATRYFNVKDPNAFCAVTGQIVNLADVYASTGFDFSAVFEEDQRTGFTTGSFVVAPLFSVDGLTLGVLQLINLRLGPDASIGPLPESSERLVRSFAAHAAVAISNARLFEENRDLIRQLDKTNRELDEENKRLRQAVEPDVSHGIIGESASMRAALDLARRAARSRVPVLLLGETGTGKDVFANAIHMMSACKDKRFVVQNCAALPETLLESELFGYKKGAFSGAIADKKGLVQEADGGTLFLDEIGDMPINLQPKILRLLEQGEVRRIGDTKAERVDVRIIAATNAALHQKMAAGSFREDLYYRLSVFPITLPPLRERPSDLSALIEFFLARAAANMRRPPPPLTPNALDALLRWRYPGNVRELRNLLDRAMLLADEGERIDLAHLPPELRSASGPIGSGKSGANKRAESIPLLPPMNGAGLRGQMRHYEALLIEAKLREAGWNQSRAAQLLQISRRSLVEKLARYAIRQPDTL
ncbi:MAG: sigma 54-interacting transcriptional regulator [Methylovirgula sp.]